MSYSPHVAIAGATGAVGEEMLKCLEQRNFPVGKISLLASARSAGRKILFRGEEHVVQELGHDSFKGMGVDFADLNGDGLFDIFVSNLKEFDEIILIGSGKGVASVKTIDQIEWKRKSLKFYKILSKHYRSAINKCPRYK